MLHTTVVGVIEYLFWILKVSANVLVCLCLYLTKGWASSHFDSSFVFHDNMEKLFSYGYQVQ